MASCVSVKLDEIGNWTEVKLDIVRGYASEYSKILAKQQKPRLDHVYIDAFAGAGVHVRKTDEGTPATQRMASWSAIS